MRRKPYTVRSLVHVDEDNRPIMETVVKAKSAEEAVKIAEAEWRSKHLTPLSTKAVLK